MKQFKIISIFFILIGGGFLFLLAVKKNPPASIYKAFDSSIHISSTLYIDKEVIKKDTPFNVLQDTFSFLSHSKWLRRIGGKWVEIPSAARATPLKRHKKINFHYRGPIEHNTFLQMFKGAPLSFQVYIIYTDKDSNMIALSRNGNGGGVFVPWAWDSSIVRKEDTAHYPANFFPYEWNQGGNEILK